MSDITERKQAEEALRESKENLQRLLETAKVIPWEADAKTWQFTYVGPQAVNFLGYPVNEWYQKDFWTSHIHPEDRESTVDFCLESTKSCKDYEFEYRMIRSDGNSIWLHDIVSVEAVNDAPKTLRGFMIDITERKQAEQAFRESQENLHLLADSLPVLISFIDTEQRYRFTNAAYEKWFGLSRDKILGRTIKEVFGESTYEFNCRQIEDALSGQHVTYETQIPLKDGGLRDTQVILTPRIDEDGTVSGIYALVSDITERKLEAKQIQQKTKELSTLHDINLAVSTTLDLQNVLNLLVEKTTQLLPYSGLFLSLYNHDKGELETIISRNFFTDELKDSRRRIVGKSFAQKIFETKTPIVVENLQTDPRVRDPEFARRHGLKSYIGLPLLVRGETLGVLGFHTKEEHDFSDEEVEFLSTLASQAAVAINNSQLYTVIAEKTVDLQKTNQQLSALYTVSSTVNKSANLDSMLQSVMREVLEIFHFDAARVYLLDSQSNELRLNLHQGFPSKAVISRSYRPGESVTGKAFAKGEPLFFEDLESDPEYRAMTLNSTALKAGFRSTFRFPIKFKEKAIGVFAFFCKSVHRYSTNEKELIHSIANHVGVAVERANLFEEINARVNELSALYSVSSTLSNSLETDLALRSGMQKVLEIFSFECARLYLFDEKEEELRLLASEGYPEGFGPSRSLKPGRGVLGKAFEDGRPRCR